MSEEFFRKLYYLHLKYSKFESQRWTTQVIYTEINQYLFKSQQLKFTPEYHNSHHKSGEKSSQTFSLVVPRVMVSKKLRKRKENSIKKIHIIVTEVFHMIALPFKSEQKSLLKWPRFGSVHCMAFWVEWDLTGSSQILILNNPWKITIFFF